MMKDEETEDEPLTEEQDKVMIVNLEIPAGVELRLIINGVQFDLDN